MDMTPRSRNDERSTVARVAEVLLSFPGSEGSLGISELARRCRLSKSTVHRLVRELVEHNLLSQEPGGRSYQLGPAAGTLGHAASLMSPLARIAEPQLRKLRDDTGESTSLSVRSGGHHIYISQVEGQEAIRIVIQIGERVPLVLGSTGQAILAHLPASQRELTIQQHSHLEGAPQDIQERLPRIRELGYALTKMERLPEAMGIAAPIFDGHGHVIGGATLAALASRTVPSQTAQLADAVKRTAQKITNDFAHPGLQQR